MGGQLRAYFNDGMMVIYRTMFDVIKLQSRTNPGVERERAIHGPVGKFQVKTAPAALKRKRSFDQEMKHFLWKPFLEKLPPFCRC